MAFEDYVDAILQQDFERGIYEQCDKEDRIEIFCDHDFANTILLDLFDTPDEWFVVFPNDRRLIALQWLLDCGYARVVLHLNIAQITSGGIDYLDKITSPQRYNEE